MPPKKGAAAATEQAAAPPEAPPSPAVIAAQKMVEKWTTRVDEVQRDKALTARQIETVREQMANSECTVRDLFTQASTLALPKPPEPDPATLKGAKGGKKAEAPPPPPPPDEEELKKIQKMQHLVMNVFKKKRDRSLMPPRETPRDEHPSGDDAADGDAEERASQVSSTAPLEQEPGLTKPPEIDRDLWKKVLKMRDERLSQEEALSTLRDKSEIMTQRQASLAKIEQLAKYSLEAAKYELQRAKERPVVPPVPAHGAAGESSATSPLHSARPPSKQSQSNRPPSQLLRR